MTRLEQLGPLRSFAVPLAVLLVAAMVATMLATAPDVAGADPALGDPADDPSTDLSIPTRQGPAGVAGAFTETFNGDVGRRAADGLHLTSGPLRWTNALDGANALGGVQGHSGLLFDRAGHLLVPTYRDTELDQLTALDTGDGSRAWTSQSTIGDGGVRPGCTSVAEDGTIWTVAGEVGDTVALVALDPQTGQELTGRRMTVGDDFALGCAAGLHLLPDDHAAALDNSTRSLHVFDLDAGQEAWTWTPAPGEQAGELLLTSADGQRVYVLADGDGDDLRLLALDATNGTQLGSVTLPGTSAPLYAMATGFVDVDGGVVLATSQGFSGSGDGWIVHVTDVAGSLSVDWQTPAFEGDDADPFGAAPRQLLPGGGDGRTVVAIDGLDQGLVGLDLTDGSLSWQAPRPGSQGLLSTEALVDAAGNVLLPYNVPRPDPGGDIPWDVVGPTGAPVGTGPAAVLTQVDAFGPLDQDGTVYGVGTLDGATAAFAVAAGVPGAAALSALPTTVGAGWATLQLHGAGAATLDTAVLVKGDDERSAEVYPSGSTGSAVATFDLTDAALGEWQLTVSGPAGPQTLDPITVEAPDGDHAIDVSLVGMPDAIKTGTTRSLTVHVRNNGNVDLNGVPVVVALDGVPSSTQLVPRDLPDPPPVPADAPAGFSWDEVALTIAGDDRVLFPALLPILGPKASTSITLDLTIPPGTGQLEQGRASVVVGDCLATNDRQPLPGSEAYTSPSFAQQAPTFLGCFGGVLLSAIGGGLGAAVGWVPSSFGEGLGATARGVGGCTLNVFLSVPSIVQNAAGRKWGPLAWDIASSLFSCLGAFVPALGLSIGVGLALGFIAAAILNCGLFTRAKDFRWGEAADPNDIVGPSGAGDARYLTAAQPLDYTVRFENMAEAGFPAAEVVITHTIDADLDPATFRPGPIGWGQFTFSPPPGAVAWEDQVAAGGTVVDVIVERDDADVTWTLRTIDPVTGAPSEDPLAGFLPPNVTPPQGEGFVSFTVQPAATVTDGTVVEAAADITFDANPAIATNTWTNTFDLIPPTGTAIPQADPSANNRLAFTLQGTDDTSGVAGWRLAAAAGEEELRQVAARHTGDAFTVTAPRGQTVRLQVQAIDGAGNVQPDPVVVEATVAVDALQRVAGPSRIDTAVEVSRSTFATAGGVVLARADTYPDALAGAPLAHGVGAPILLTGSEALPAVVAEEIGRLGASTAVVLGGEAAIGPQVVAALEELGVGVSRIAGASRFATAAAIGDQLAPSDRVFLVEGANADPARGWPDALAVAPLAARLGAPILLATRDELPVETAAALDTLAPTQVTIVGGTAALSEAVADQVRAAGFDVDRIAGADRYTTGLAVADEATALQAATPQVTWLATGLNFPDALAAGPAVAATAGQLLLLHGEVPAASQAVLDRLADDGAELLLARLAGGTAAVSADAEAAVRAVLAASPPG